MRNPESLLSVFALLPMLVSCAPAPRPVRPDDMSAAAHRREAVREQEEADRHVAEFEPRATQPVTPMGPVVDVEDTYIYPTTVYNPTEHHLDEAVRHHAHAAEHDAAARELERFEEAQCGELPPETRSACPILHGVASIVDVPHGVRITFAPDEPVAAVVAHLRCHAAWARTRGYPAEMSCPLYRKGIRVVPDADGKSIDVTIDDADMVDVIRKQIRREALPAGTPIT